MWSTAKAFPVRSRLDENQNRRHYVTVKLADNSVHLTGYEYDNLRDAQSKSINLRLQHSLITKEQAEELLHEINEAEQSRLEH